MSTAKKAILIILFVVLLLLAGALGAAYYLFPHVGSGFVYRMSEHYAADDLTSSDLDALLNLSRLTVIDLRGSDLSAADYDRLRAAYPDAELLWTVPVNGQRIDCGATSLTLKNATEADLAMLPYLPNLHSVRATETDCYDALKVAEAAYPDVAFSWTVREGDITVERDITEFDVTEPIPFETLTALFSKLDDLNTVKLTSSHLSNAQTAELIAAFPNAAFTYRVHLGDTLVDPDLAALKLGASSGVYTPDEVLEAKPYLPQLTEIDLRELNLTNEALAETLGALKDFTVQYNVSVCGRTVAPDIASLDLSGVPDATASSLSDALPLLPNLRTVSLGTWSRTAEELNKFLALNNGITFTYSFSYLGNQLDNTAEELDLHGTKITDLDGLKAILPLLPNLKKVDMVDCGLDDETMGGLVKAFPDTKFIWEVDLGFWGKLRTDATAYTTRSSKTEDQMKYRLTTATVQPLQYCTDLVALDLGHQQIDDISCLASLTKLQVLILADNRLTDISALASMPDLIYVELFMNRISDLSPLSGLKNLKDLNLCTNKISDLTPLYTLTSLERLWYSNNLYTKADHDALAAVLTNCRCNRTVWDETADGWREHERYFWMRSFFEHSPRYK